MTQSIKLPLNKKVNLANFDPNYTGKYKSKKEMRKRLLKTQAEIIELQELLYAESKHALLIVLQAMDAGGKDGTIQFYNIETSHKKLKPVIKLISTNEKYNFIASLSHENEYAVAVVISEKII